MESRMPNNLLWIVGASTDSVSKKALFDAFIAGVGISASLFAGLGPIKTLLAVVVSALMVLLLVLRIYNEYRRAKRQDAKDREEGDDER